MPRVGFRPEVHRFHFTNEFTNTVLVGPFEFETRGRCGGMALAALDYYFAGVPIPAYKREHFAPWFVVPPDHHWVADYIAFRLYSSYLEPDFWNVDWFAAGNRASDSELSSSKKNFWFPRLRESIDAGSPVPLGLIRGSSSYLTDMNQNHVVVAYGYDFDPGSGAMRVYVYDNNHRDREITLSSDPSTPHFATSTGGPPWRGFFVMRYELKNVRATPFAAVAPAPGLALRYGDTFKLSHVMSGRTLHSHLHNYGHAGGSSQQQVTAFGGADDNDLWRVKGPHGQPEYFRAGQPVHHGDVVRLEHVLTKKNLHSHGPFRSPVTEQQEVTCFGENGIGDANDDWRLEAGEGGTWDAGERTRLVHVATDRTLHSHTGVKLPNGLWLPFSHPQWTMGQQEVTGFDGRDPNDWWLLLEVRPLPMLAATFVTQSVPGTMTPGQRVAVSVTMRNTGYGTWSPQDPAPFRLGSQNPQDNARWGLSRVDLPHQVEPGAEVAFAFEVTAPQDYGRYAFSWRMLQGTGEWFGEPSANVFVEVTECEQIRQEVPGSASGSRCCGRSLRTRPRRRKPKGRPCSAR